MAGQKRTKTEYRGIYYNETTGKYDIKFNYKSYNAAKQRNDYKSKWKYNVATIGEARTGADAEREEQAGGQGYNITGGF